MRIFKAYREEAIKVVTHAPYRLATDVWGIGFKTADKIAQGVGIAYDSGERVKAGLQFTLSQASELGHRYLPEPELVARASEILGVRPELAQSCLDELVRQQGVVRDPVPIPGFDDGVAGIYLLPFHRAEVSLAAGLLRLRARCPSRPTHCPCSARSTGRPPSPGWRGSPAAGSPPSRRRRSASP